MIEQCLPAEGSLHDDWMLWVELWLHAARRPDLRVTSARLYARMYEWFAETVGRRRERRGELTVADRDRTIDRLLALIDGYGIRTLIEDPAMPLERARAEIWAAIAPELGSVAALRGSARRPSGRRRARRPPASCSGRA